MGRILVVDDDMARGMALRILTDAGYIALAARDGEEAIQILESHPDKIQLLLLDVIMPKANGKTVYDRSRQLCPQLPILFCSGYSIGVLDSSLAPRRRRSHDRQTL
ncbi:MAG: response regulator [Candidatus Sumerlaeota bacterium]|nr:response regulator [Candidatus Sumerlaeota bacterium]